MIESAETIERFWSKVERKGPDDCWLWTGAGAGPEGYGNFWTGSKTRSAHKVSFWLSGRTLKPGECVLHRCDVRRCCNPAHLFAGTQRDNMDDMTAKGRRAMGANAGTKTIYCGDDHHARQHPERMARGEAVGGARLTADIVKAFRERYAAGGVSTFEIARELGVSQTAVWSAIVRRSWKHVE